MAGDERVRRDDRIKPIRRVIEVTIIDYTNIDFSQHDLEWMGDHFEEKLHEKFDVDVDLIEVRLVAG